MAETFFMLHGKIKELNLIKNRLDLLEDKNTPIYIRTIDIYDIQVAKKDDKIFIGADHNHDYPIDLFDKRYLYEDQIDFTEYNKVLDKSLIYYFPQFDVYGQYLYSSDMRKLGYQDKICSCGNFFYIKDKENKVFCPSCGKDPIGEKVVEIKKLPKQIIKITLNGKKYSYVKNRWRYKGVEVSKELGWDLDDYYDNLNRQNVLKKKIEKYEN